MKPIRFFFLFFMIQPLGILAQIAINTTGDAPAATSMLDITSTDKGILIPRMDDTAMNDIDSPATGLLIYNTSANQFYYFDGTSWIPVGEGATDNDWKINGDDMYSQPSGNVGIGTDAPELKLDVNGDIRHGNHLYLYSQSSGGKKAWVSFNSPNQYGDNIVLGAGATTIAGAGESVNYTKENVDMTNGHETFYLTADADIRLITNLDGGWDERQDALLIQKNGNWNISADTIFLHDETLGNNKVRFFTRTEYHYGYGVTFCPGSGLALGGGESANTLGANLDLSNTEILYLTSDQKDTNKAIQFITNLQDNWDERVVGVTILGNGHVGIGTESPVGLLHLGGDSNDAGPNDTDNPGSDFVIGPLSGAHVEYDTNEIHAMDGDDGAPLYINADGGDVVIGAHVASDANDRLKVYDLLHLVPRDEPSSASEGDIYYDKDDHKLKLRTNNGWVNLN